MDTLAPWLILRKPKNVLEKPITVDRKALFKSLLKMTKYVAAIHAGAPIKPEEIIPDLGEMLSVFGLKDAPEELAGKLVTQAVTRAILELLKENAILLNITLKNPKAFEADVEVALISEPFQLDRNFFKHPERHAILPAIQPVFETYLLEHGMVKERVATVVGRLPSYYAYALNADWAKNAKYYDPVKSALETPFTDAVAHQAAWDAYATFLNKQIEESLFQESFSLRDVYIPLRAAWEERPKQREDKTIRHVVNLQMELDAWLAKGDRNDAIRVISGGPGSGKSSFGKIFAAHRAEQGDRVLFIPLHLFAFANDLESAVHKYVRDANLLPHKPLDQQEGESRLLLLFDGLDELAMQGKAAREAVQVFVREVYSFVRVRNTMGLRVQALLAGRDIVIQDNATEFKQEEQILYVLPYALTDEEQRQYNYVDLEELWKEDRRGLWWRAYGSSTGTWYDKMPEELARTELDAITAQPLLNYLVALSYQRKTLDFAKLDNVNLVYEDLLQSVHKRPWGQGGSIHSGRIALEDFCDLLEEIALAIWHGDGRTTTEKTILKRCQDAGIADRLTLLEKEAEAGVTRLLVAFFFRQHGRDTDTNERTFEFTHKSFGEYLTARRLVRGLELMREERERRKHKRSGWTDEDALHHWAEWCGPTAMDAYLLTFLRDEVRLKDPNDREEWQKMAADLIDYVLMNGMPMEKFGQFTYQEMMRQSRNAEEALLAAHSACVIGINEPVDIAWPAVDSARSWFVRLCSSEEGREKSIASSCLNCLRLSDQNLYWILLREANLEGANLQKANLTGANLYNANFCGANLEEADLQRAHLYRASFYGANLQAAILCGANLERTDLQRTNLQGAHLQGATFEGAYLERADLQGANLYGAEFEGANKVELARNLDKARGVSEDILERWKAAEPERKKRGIE